MPTKAKSMVDQTTCISRKRPRSEDETTSDNSSQPPPYGSKEYWERRYEKQFQTLSLEEKNKEETTLAYHSWYFTYSELRPLLLPLIFGGRKEATDVLIDVQVGDDDGKEETEPSETNDPAVDTSKNEHDSDNDEEDEFEEAEMEDEHEEETLERDGLAVNGPISVLEIGCGDVPLGAALTLELKDLEQTTGAPASSIVKQILCTDYSQVVVEKMKQQYCHRRTASTVDTNNKNIKKDYSDCEPSGSESVDIGNLPLEFAAVDARKLPYKKESIELVIEKGTLDAVLSDTVSGVSDCVSIIAECARVLTKGGYMVLISHLNAHTPNGLAWLEEVVFTGLKKGDSDNKSAWEIEVHGNAEVVEEDSRVPPGSAGPAVYIIHKKKPLATEKVTQNDDNSPTIPVKLFSY